MYDTNNTNDPAGRSSSEDGGEPTAGAYRHGADQQNAPSDTLFTLHDTFDRRDGHSRFGDCLARNRWMWRDKNHTLTTEPVQFAAAAFQVGSAPMMNPPYVGTHPRVVRAYPRTDQHNRHVLIAELAVPTHPTLLDQLPRPCEGWDRDQRGAYRPPQEYDRLVAYVRLILGVPIHADLLPDPAYDKHGVPDLDIARRALRAITTQASAIGAQLLGSIEDIT